MGVSSTIEDIIFLILYSSCGYVMNIHHCVFIYIMLINYTVISFIIYIYSYVYILLTFDTYTEFLYSIIQPTHTVRIAGVATSYERKNKKRKCGQWS